MWIFQNQWWRKRFLSPCVRTDCSSKRSQNSSWLPVQRRLIWNLSSSSCLLARLLDGSPLCASPVHRLIRPTRSSAQFPVCRFRDAPSGLFPCLMQSGPSLHSANISLIKPLKRSWFDWSEKHNPHKHMTSRLLMFGLLHVASPGPGSFFSMEPRPDGFPSYPRLQESECYMYESHTADSFWRKKPQAPHFVKLSADTVLWGLIKKLNPSRRKTNKQRAASQSPSAERRLTEALMRTCFTTVQTLETTCQLLSPAPQHYFHHLVFIYSSACWTL